MANRMRCIALAAELFGPEVKIRDEVGGMKIVGRDLGSKKKGIPFAFMGFGVSGRTWAELEKALLRRARADRLDEVERYGHGYLAAAVRAAAEGHDVREPCRLLWTWIETGEEA